MHASNEDYNTCQNIKEKQFMQFLILTGFFILNIPSSVTKTLSHRHDNYDKLLKFIVSSTISHHFDSDGHLNLYRTSIMYDSH